MVIMDNPTAWHVDGFGYYINSINLLARKPKALIEYIASGTAEPLYEIELYEEELTCVPTTCCFYAKATGVFYKIDDLISEYEWKYH